jgi:hypothetical protein
MRLRVYDPVVLSLDLRHRRFGYAVFQGHRVLLEWGQRYYPAVGDTEREIAQRRISKLLNGHVPDLILLKQERWDRAHNDVHLANPLAALQVEADRYSVPIRLVREEAVRMTFATFGCRTKADIAATVASLYPELLRSVPPQRKAWQTEHPRMSVFDAVALGVAYWLRGRDHLVIDNIHED